MEFDDIKLIIIAVSAAVVLTVLIVSVATVKIYKHQPENECIKVKNETL